MRLLMALPFCRSLLLGSLLSAPLWSDVTSADEASPLAPAITPSGEQGMLNVSRSATDNTNACDVGLYVQSQMVGKLAPGAAITVPVPTGQISIGVMQVGSQACIKDADVVHSQSALIQPNETKFYKISSDQSGVFLSPQ